MILFELQGLAASPAPAWEKCRGSYQATGLRQFQGSRPTLTVFRASVFLLGSWRELLLQKELGESQGPWDEEKDGFN